MIEPDYRAGNARSVATAEPERGAACAAQAAQGGNRKGRASLDRGARLESRIFLREKVRRACTDLHISHCTVKAAQPFGFLGRTADGQLHGNRPIKCAGEEGS